MLLLIVIALVVVAIGAVVFYSNTDAGRQAAQDAELKRVGREIAEVEAEMDVIREYGSCLAVLGEVEVRTSGVYRLPPNGGIQAATAFVPMSGTLVATARDEGEVTETVTPGKRRTTATRVVLGGAIAGTKGAVIGAMAKKQKPDTVNRTDSRRVVLAFKSPEADESIEVVLPFSQRGAVSELAERVVGEWAVGGEALRAQDKKEVARLRRKVRTLERRRDSPPVDALSRKEARARGNARNEHESQPSVDDLIAQGSEAVRLVDSRLMAWTKTHGFVPQESRAGRHIQTSRGMVLATLYPGKAALEVPVETLRSDNPEAADNVWRAVSNFIGRDASPKYPQVPCETAAQDWGTLESTVLGSLLHGWGPQMQGEGESR